MLTHIEKRLSARLKPKPAAGELGFGVHFTDHMFIMDYEEGRGWHSPRIVPYGPLSLEPAAMSLHYAQSVFEGMKAYRTKDGRALLFRPHKNFSRLRRSCERLSIPPIDEETALHALCELIRTDREWIPDAPGTSLYIRPFIIATEPHLGVAPAKRYSFMIILSPVGAYYAEGLNPVSIWVEPEYIRAVRGGIGATKAAANYAASLKAQAAANAKGYTQVLWLDGVERRFIEEVGSMNVFFKIGGKVITPALSGSILDGVTRDTVITLLQSWNVPVEERAIAIEEIVEAYRSGALEEAFGTGTAAVISPIGEINWHGERMAIAGGRIGDLAKRLYDTITGVQTGAIPDEFGWTMEV